MEKLFAFVACFALARMILYSLQEEYYKPFWTNVWNAFVCKDLETEKTEKL